MHIISREVFTPRWSQVFRHANLPCHLDGVVVHNVENWLVRRLAWLTKFMLRWAANAKDQPWEDYRFSGECLITIFEWSIWDSSELLPMFRTWQLGALQSSDGTVNPPLPPGVESTPSTHPGYIFGPDETPLAEGLVAMGLMFGWGLCIGDTGTGRVIGFDHDGSLFVPGKEATIPDLDLLRKYLNPSVK